MAKKLRKATAGSVSAFLGKRFTRATSSPSMNRGFKNWSSGFRVRTAWDGKVEVKHMGYSFNVAAQRAKVEGYAAVLQEAYTVRVLSGGRVLVVTEKKP